MKDCVFVGHTNTDMDSIGAHFDSVTSVRFCILFPPPMYRRQCCRGSISLWRPRCTSRGTHLMSIASQPLLAMMQLLMYRMMSMGRSSLPASMLVSHYHHTSERSKLRCNQNYEIKFDYHMCRFLQQASKYSM